MTERRGSVAYFLKLTDERRLYAIPSLYQAFRPLVSLNLEKRLAEGYAIDKRGLYALAWLGIILRGI